MASTVTQRAELAKFCSSRDWSKAIRVLDSLLSQSCVIQDICNRAYCYSKLELHKHVIKDCDKAMELDPTLLQAYILKGRAYSALGRKDDAVMVWERGYEYAVCQSADLKQLLELEELLTVAKQSMAASLDKDAKELLEWSVSKSVPANSSKSSETFNNHIESKPNETSYVPNGSSKKAEGSNYIHVGSNGNHDKQQNGTYTEVHSSTSDSCNTSNLSTKLSFLPGKSSDTPDTRSKGSDKSDMRSEVSNDAKGNKKFSVTRISKAKSINVDFRLSRGIAQVNEGQYARAISIFDQILREDPTYPEALIGRGTAYAFKRELDSAIADFTKALESNPSAGEAWKRRGQARAALGESVEAIADLTKSLEFEPDSADILHERGIVNFKLKDFYAATADLSACVKLDKENKSAYTYLGLALSSVGEYKKAEEAHLKATQIDQKFLDAWGHLAQFYQDLANSKKASKKAFQCLQQVLEIDARFAKGYHLRGLLLHAMGDHRNAIKDLSEGLTLESSNIECLYLRASCYHAVGEYKEAVKDYDAALDLELDSMDKFVLQCLAFYQKEIALYTSAKINSEFSWFDIDGDIDPLFKEYWCKRLHPKNVCEKVYRQPPLRKAKLKKQDFTLTKPKTALLHAADRIGKTIQYHCPGFLPNRRQHRMAGLAAIEIAQRVSKVWRSLQSEWRFSTKNNTSKNGKRLRRKEKIIIPSQNRGGAGCSTSRSSEPSTSSPLEEKSSGRSVFSWLHLYSVAVKWRQISEPCDPVVWVNKLSEEFNSGFGSHTPLILGQARVTRYYPHFQRTLDVAKTVMKENGCVHNKADCTIDLSKDGKLNEIMKAESCSDLYKVVGEDFWLATWCKSTAFEGKRLEGTRITLVKSGEQGFEFAIRTPCTPARWDDFDAEMASAWEVLCNAYCGETYGSNDFGTLENVREAILRMTYYWYNFMPLSRGSAVVGFTVMLGLLLAANMEFTGSIPEGDQVDWDAILSLDPNSFMESIKSWLYPSLKITTSWKDIPEVASTLETTGSVVGALSTYTHSLIEELAELRD